MNSGSIWRYLIHLNSDRNILSRNASWRYGDTREYNTIWMPEYSKLEQGLSQRNNCKYSYSDKFKKYIFVHAAFAGMGGFIEHIKQAELTIQNLSEVVLYQHHNLSYPQISAKLCYSFMIDNSLWVQWGDTNRHIDETASCIQLNEAFSLILITWNLCENIWWEE